MYCYSPRPMNDYAITGVRSDEVAVIRGMGEMFAPAIWNLFWMSMPSIDAVPEKGTTWWKHYKPHPEALSTIIDDVTGDIVLFKKLTMHPSDFIAWFEREDHSIYDCFNLWDEDWASTVLSRAREAMSHIVVDKGRVQVRGNVFTVQFKRQA